MAELETYRGYYLWLYLPSITASAIFVILFAAITTAHLWIMIKARTWFCLPFFIGVLFEVIGYVARTVAHNETGKLMPYVIQSTYILLAPALFAASIYMTAGRIIRSVHGESFSVVRVNWLTRIFVLGDVLSFVVQGSAAGLMVTANNLRLGEDIIVAGLFIQIIMFGLFVATMVIFHLRFQRDSASEGYNDQIPWRRGLYMLYVVSALVMIRSIFRVVEYIGGQSGYSLTHEWTLYIFDSLPMFTVMVIFFVWYPRSLRVTVQNVELTTNQK